MSDKSHSRKEEEEEKKNLPKGWIKGEEKKILLCVQRKERQEGKSLPSCQGAVLDTQ